MTVTEEQASTGGARSDCGPAGEPRALQADEPEDASEGALDAVAFAEFVQMDGTQERLFGRLRFQGITATAPRARWIQRIRARPQ